MEHGSHNCMRTCRGRMALEGATNGLPVDAANSEHAPHRVGVWVFVGLDDVVDVGVGR